MRGREGSESSPSCRGWGMWVGGLPARNLTAPGNRPAELHSAEPIPRLTPPLQFMLAPGERGPERTLLLSRNPRAAPQHHPSAAIFPLLPENELADLAEDIRAAGLLEPIELLDGLILDGRNRQLACDRAGVEPTYRPADLGGLSPTEYVISKNLKRRHLTESQRAMVAQKALPFLEQEARERQGTRTDISATWHGSSKEALPDKGKAAEKAGEMFNVSARTVYRAKKVAEEDAGLAERVLAGEVSAKAAYDQVRARQKEAEVTEAIASGRALTDLKLMETLGLNVRPYDVWTFGQCDPRFGADYPGRIPGQLVAQVLYFFTEQGDLVVDLGKDFGNRCRGVVDPNELHGTG